MAEHVLELHRVPPELRTSSERLLDWVAQRAGRLAAGVSVRWHDSTSALLIFPSASSAAEALKHLSHKDMQVMRLRESFQREHESASPIGPLPGPSRPDTDTSVARRLVRAALGSRLRQEAAAQRSAEAARSKAVGSQAVYLRPVPPERAGGSGAEGSQNWRAGAAESRARGGGGNEEAQGGGRSSSSASSSAGHGHGGGVDGSPLSATAKEWVPGAPLPPGPQHRGAVRVGQDQQQDPAMPRARGRGAAGGGMAQDWDAGQAPAARAEGGAVGAGEPGTEGRGRRGVAGGVGRGRGGAGGHGTARGLYEGASNAAANDTVPRGEEEVEAATGSGGGPRGYQSHGSYSHSGPSARDRAEQRGYGREEPAGHAPRGGGRVGGGGGGRGGRRPVTVDSVVEFPPLGAS